jgi:hypothetical protein
MYENITRAKERRLVIVLEHKFGEIEWHESGHGNSKLGRDVWMSESTVRNIAGG